MLIEALRKALRVALTFRRKDWGSKRSKRVFQVIVLVNGTVKKQTMSKSMVEIWCLMIDDFSSKEHCFPIWSCWLPRVVKGLCELSLKAYLPHSSICPLTDSWVCFLLARKGSLLDTIFQVTCNYKVYVIQAKKLMQVSLFVKIKQTNKQKVGNSLEH